MVAIGAAAAGVVLAVALVPVDVLHLGSPMAHEGNAVFHLAAVKALAADGTQAMLAAPVGADLGAFRLPAEPINLALLVVIARLTGDVMVAMNLFVLLLFALGAAAAALVARRLGLPPLVAVAAGVLYAFLPLQLDLVRDHPLLGVLWGVPIAVSLAADALSGSLDGRAASLVRAAALGVLVAASGWLVGVVAAVAVALAALLGAIGRGWRPLAAGLAVAAVIVVASGGFLALARSDAPTDVRATEVTDPGRVTVADLVLPRQGHRIGAAAAVRDAYDAREPNGDSTAALGVIGVIGLGILLAAVLLDLRGRRGVLGTRLDWRFGIWAVGLIVIFGSGGVLRAMGSVVPAMDRWTPVAAFIGFAALVAVGGFLARAMAWASARRGLGRLAIAGLVVGVVLIGVLDQTSAPDSAPGSDISTTDARDEALIRELEGEFEAGAAMFQLPVVADPAAPTAALAPYEQLKPFVHGRQLAWSASLGPPAAWQQQVVAGPARLMPVALTSLGFDAIVIDRAGYADGGAGIEATLRSVLDEPPMRISDDRVAVFDLRPTRERLEAAHGPDVLDEVGRSLLESGSYDSAPFDARLELVADGFVQPVGIVEVPDGSGRLAVVERAGTIRIVEADGTVRREPLLDLGGTVETGVIEQGLLGLAFHPDFVRNGRLFIDYTAHDDDVVVAELHVTGEPSDLVADSETAIELFRVAKPSGYHNGGQLLFGPDGYLYASFGDGVIDFPTVGPVGTGQDRSTMRGSIVRVDVDRGDPYAIPADNPLTGDGGRPETWVYGLRNPWRFSFDSVSGDLFIGDVGQLSVEEVDVQRAGSGGGENYGWRAMMGSACFEGACDPADFVTPLYEYAHGDGRCAITGGYVYRGDRSDDVYGEYVFGDLCSGQVWSLDQDIPGAVAVERLDTDMMITTFAQRADGELLAADFTDGAIYSLVFAPSR